MVLSPNDPTFFSLPYLGTILANALGWRESNRRNFEVIPIQTLVRQFFPVLFICGLGACQEVEQGASEEEYIGSPARGRAFAQVNCSTCHAIDETGDSPYAPALPFRTLSEYYPIENLAEAFAEGIGVGHSGDVQMPEFVLSPNEIDDLLTYLATLQE